MKFLQSANVNVSVIDKRGNPVKGLKPEQFEIFDKACGHLLLGHRIFLWV